MAPSPMAHGPAHDPGTITRTVVVSPRVDRLQYTETSSTTAKKAVPDTLSITRPRPGSKVYPYPNPFLNFITIWKFELPKVKKRYES